MFARDCRTQIAQYRRDLEVQLQQKDVEQKIEWLRETYPVFKRYPSVEKLAALVGPGNPAYADKDAALGALLAEIKRKTTLFPLLNLVLWDSLISIFWRKRKSVPDLDELFWRIQADFCHTALTYPLDRRPRKININLYRDTWKKVTAWQQEEAEYRQHHIELATDPKGPASDEESGHPEDAEPYLLSLQCRGLIGGMERDLLLETEVYARMTQKEWAEAHGVKHSTVRSWRHRAVQAIQEYEKAARRRREQEALD